MSERIQSPESRDGKVLRFLENFNKVSAAVFAGAGVVAYSFGSPELAVTFGGLALLDVAGAAFWKGARTAKNKLSTAPS